MLLDIVRRPPRSVASGRSGAAPSLASPEGPARTQKEA